MSSEHEDELEKKALPAKNVGSRQFSLRTLLMLVLASGVVFGAGRVLGAAVFGAMVFALLWVVPLVVLRGPRKRAYVLSWLAVYGPFVAMAVYTLMFVDCSHCKAAAWTLLPSAPGLILFELARRPLDLPRPPDEVWAAISFVAASVVVGGLTWLLHILGRWWQALCVVAILALGALGAAGLLAAIRA